MEHKLEPLTGAEEKELFELSKNPDPMARLQSNYYQLRQRQIFDVYKAALQENEANDYNERVKLQKAYFLELDELGREYNLDIDQAMQLHLMMLGVMRWRPTPTA